MQRIIKQISALMKKRQIASQINFSDNLEDSEGAAIYGGIATAEYSATSNRQTTIEEKNSLESAENSAVNIPALNNWSTSLQNVLDQPPSSLPFRMMLAGMTFCLAFGTWATLGQIEEVGHAQGLLVPEGEALKVNPVVLGKVARIAVKEGETVKAGQVLLELDNQIARSEVERLEKERASYQTQLLQTEALMEKTRLEAQSHQDIAAAREKGQLATIAQAEEKIRTTTELLAQLQREAEAYKGRRDKLAPLAAMSEKLLKQLEVDALSSKARWQQVKPLTATTEDLLKKLQVDADAAKERVERLRPLVEQGALPKERLADLEQAWRDRQRAVMEAKLAQDNNLKAQVFQAEQSWQDRQRAIIQTQLQQDTSVKEQLFQAQQAWRDRQRSIIQRQSDLQQAKSELNRLLAEQKQNQAEAQTTKLQDQQKFDQLELQKTQIQAKITQTEQLLNQAKTQLKQLTFTAPVDGVVSSLNVRNPGEVVQPGQTAIELAPEDAPLVLLAKLPNHEAGFVKTGMPVKVKLDAYPYQDYGIISGKVRTISPDAKPDERFGAVYRVEVELERNFVKTNQRKIPFKAGQTATADIVIRERRIIDVLLDPIKQMQQGGLDL
ncbi:HlyD family efflux transporter periplasmic adaptor subunit [Aerosakkonemataceae cyanobacterium BLCC-F154]|uniref:HlyD family efflux transporter periplasmic adaptor subunit n=1 Tax=Floridaenema fluviatile BLCC-F154 TaxID=3153640 RepID=A0ABV4Y5C2_9CYAN